MGLALACELCPLVLPVPEGAKITTLPLCPSCAEGTMVIVQSQQETEAPLVEEEEPVSFDFLPEPIAKDEVQKFINDKFPGATADESEMLSNRINRLTPLILATQVIADIKRSGSEVDEAKVIQEFGEIGRQYRKELRKIEDREGIGRGLRLSDGFPRDDSDNHLRVWTRLFIGGDPNDLMMNRHGLGQQLGIIEVDGSPRTVSLNKRAEAFLPIELPSGREIEMKEYSHPSLNKTVRMPVWIDRKNVDSILDFITQAARAEMLWLKDVLGQTEGIAVSADEIADKEIDAIVNGTRDQNRWLDSSGKPVVDIVRSKAVEEGWDEERLEHAIVDQLESRIFPTVNSTLGRLKELGLVYPVKRGRRTLYKATPAGNDWIGNWDREDS